MKRGAGSGKKEKTGNGGQETGNGKAGNWTGAEKWTLTLSGLVHKFHGLR